MRSFGDMIDTLDALIQKRFNAAMHHLMREYGRTKRQLRKVAYFMQMGGAVVLGASFIAKTGLSTLGRASSCTMLLLALVAIFMMMTHTERKDITAEHSPGTISEADDARVATGAKRQGALLLACCGLALLLNLTYGMTNQDIRLKLVVFFLALSHLYHGYLIRTPPASPKPKTEEIPDALPSRA